MCRPDWSHAKILRHAEELAFAADTLQRAHGGQGLEIRDLEIPREVGAPAGCPDERYAQAPGDNQTGAPRSADDLKVTLTAVEAANPPPRSARRNRPREVG